MDNAQIRSAFEAIAKAVNARIANTRFEMRVVDSSFEKSPPRLSMFDKNRGIDDSWWFSVVEIKGDVYVANFGEHHNRKWKTQATVIARLIDTLQALEKTQQEWEQTHNKNAALLETLKGASPYYETHSSTMLVRYRNSGVTAKAEQGCVWVSSDALNASVQLNVTGDALQAEICRLLEVEREYSAARKQAREAFKTDLGG